MNMRWGWTLPVLTALVMGLPTGTVWSQYGPASSPMGGGAPAAGMADPAMLAAMQAQAMAAQQQAAYGPYAGPAMYGPPPGYPAQAMYAPQGMYQPGVQPVGYMMVAPGTPGMQAPGPFPAGQSPDVYGSYGSVPTDYAAAGYGQQGPGGYPPEGYGGGPGMGGPGMYDQGAMGGGGGPMGANGQYY